MKPENFQSLGYDEKKHFLEKVLTIYGRNPVKEALLNTDIGIFKLHLADSNRKSSAIDDLMHLANSRSVPIEWHDRKRLSRISKNSKQDQGVALDLILSNSKSIEEFCSSLPNTATIIALDKITNPQNLGMIVRSVCASPNCVLLLPAEGCARIDSLVIKASSGTLFRASIVRCTHLVSGLNELKNAFKKLGLPLGIAGLKTDADTPLSEFVATPHQVFVLGNESRGLGQDTQGICNHHISIPMNNNVESLNVAVTASLLAFRSIL